MCTKTDFNVYNGSMVRVAINGFGRIGRCFFRAVQARPDAGLEIVAVNDPGSIENLAYLLKYDSVYGRAPFEVGVAGGALIADGKTVAFSQERDPKKAPWKDLAIAIVVESTGIFTDAEKARGHIEAGASRVVITAPAKGEGVETVLVGANEDKLATCTISSNASCTTNAASPLIGILNESIGIERAILNTVHAYTATQLLVDGTAGDDFRRGRAGAMNLVPSSTGAAKATTLAYTTLAGKFDGVAIRVPTISGSLVDVTFVAKRPTSAKEVNDILKKAATSDLWKRVFAVTEEPLVSSDILGQPYGAIADLPMTRVVDGTLVKVLAWYDNEMGYCHTLVEHVSEVAKHL